MALDNNDVFPIYRGSDNTTRKASISALLAMGGTASLWKEDGDSVTPKKAGADLAIEGEGTFAGSVRIQSIVKSESDSGFQSKADSSGGMFAFRATDNADSDNAIIYSDGSATFAGGVDAQKLTSTITGDYAFRVNGKGGYFVDPDGDEQLYIRNGDISQPLITLSGTDGSASFSGSIECDSIDGGSY